LSDGSRSACDCEGDVGVRYCDGKAILDADDGDTSGGGLRRNFGQNTFGMLVEESLAKERERFTDQLVTVSHSLPEFLLSA
jgi:hypothetical protein